MPRMEVHIDEATHAAITEISRSSHRPVEEIVGEAVADYAAWHAEKMRAAREGWADYEAGRVASPEDVDAFFDDWIKNG